MIDLSGLNIDELKAIRAKIDAVLDGPADDNATLDDLVSKLRGVREKVASVGKVAVNKAIKVFFDAHPEVESVRWTQYTPYFNDGDACVFSVHEPQVRLKADGSTGNLAANDGEEADEDEGGYREGWDIGYEARQRKQPEPAVVGSLNKLYEAFNEAEDAMRAVFGDHVRVTIGRDLEAKVEEYSHD